MLLRFYTIERKKSSLVAEFIPILFLLLLSFINKTWPLKNSDHVLFLLTIHTDHCRTDFLQSESVHTRFPHLPHKGIPLHTYQIVS